MALTFMFFRCRSLDDVSAMTTQIVNDFHLSDAPQFVEGYLLIILAKLLGLFMHFSPKRWSDRMRDRFDRAPLVIQAFILAIVLVLIIQVRQSDIVPFIYLQY